METMESHRQDTDEEGKVPPSMPQEPVSSRT